MRRLSLFRGLVLLVILTFFVNVSVLVFFFLTGKDEGDGGVEDNLEDEEAWDPAVIVRNASVPSIRFGIKDDDLIILVPKNTYPFMISTAQAIRSRFKIIQEQIRKSKRLSRKPVPLEAAKLERILTQTERRSKLDFKEVWVSASQWPFSDSLRFLTIGQILHSASTSKILNATSVQNKGTQLKVQLTLEGGQIAYWKPAWYPRSIILNGTAYAGKDRHFGEIASFYLNLLLGFNNAPLVVGRKLNLVSDLLSVSSPELKSTFYRGPSSSFCFYGVCPYCSKRDPVCGDANNNELEGALVLLLGPKFRTIPNPWRRRYATRSRKKDGVTSQAAPWELIRDFCPQSIPTSPTLPKNKEILLDIVSLAVFDFLIGNGDRHRLDISMRSNKIIFLDNGKSFGNPWEDYIDILAPLFQCCKIRESFYQTLKKYQGQLSFWMENITSADPLFPLLTKDHLFALDRRLNIVLATVNYCKDKVEKYNSKKEKENTDKNKVRAKRVFY